MERAISSRKESKYENIFASPWKKSDVLVVQGTDPDIVERATSRRKKSKHENIFASPWKKSDIVLVVQGTEFHVHRCILTMQSPVFEAMFDGHFKEANQDRITLEDESSDDVLQFLKLLYPPSMISTPLVSMSGEHIYKLLVLADKYRAEDVLNHCLKETKISPDNAVRIIPYAAKYNPSLREKCIEMMKRSRTEYLERQMAGLDSQLVQELLLEKCHFLESVVREGKHMLTYMMKRMLSLKNAANKDKDEAKLYDFAERCTACRRTVSIDKFPSGRTCEQCLLTYETNVIENVLKQHLNKKVMLRREDSYFSTKDEEKRLLNLLQDIDELLA